jgi:phosphate starvation-inducible PhoH-like protein
VDLPPGTTSGLADAVERLESVPGVGVVRLNKRDIVRHPLVQAIVNAYEMGESAAAAGVPVGVELSAPPGPVPHADVPASG